MRVSKSQIQDLTILPMLCGITGTLTNKWFYTLTSWRYQNPKSKISRFCQCSVASQEHWQTSDSRHLLVEGIEMPNPRSTKVQDPKSRIQHPKSKTRKNPTSKIQINPVFSGSGGEKARERKLKKESTWLRCQQPLGKPPRKKKSAWSHKHKQFPRKKN